ncbi:MAG: hypothetical protein A2Z25_09830 [Planctomycetes bacterium RBG_16_55_9]|nr:MAG: hypothetical protein A2Z25_09830 [Planctomycetes bacterium RBG_16_55_9]
MRGYDMVQPNGTDAEPTSKDQAASGTKSIFDDGFSYLKIPREVFEYECQVWEVRWPDGVDGQNRQRWGSKPFGSEQEAKAFLQNGSPKGAELISTRQRLTPSEVLVVAFVAYRCGLGAPCRETNQQFADLIRKSEGQTQRIICSLIDRKILAAGYRSDGFKRRLNSYRSLKTHVGVTSGNVMKLFAGETARLFANKPPKLDEKTEQSESNLTVHRAGAVNATVDRAGADPMHSAGAVNVPQRRRCGISNNKEYKEAHRQPAKAYLAGQAALDEAQRQRRILFEEEKQRDRGVKKLQSEAP